MSEQAVEEFPYGSKRYRIDDDSIIVIYGSGNMSRDALNAWGNLVIDTVAATEIGSTVYLLLDLTNPRQGFTPHTRTVVEHVYRNVPVEREIFAAVLMRDTIIIQIVTGLVNRLHRTRPGLTQRLFNDRETALAWLRQMRQSRD